MIRFLTLLALSAALAACQSTRSNVGSGHIVLSPTAKATLNAYLAHENKGYFAVSKNGRSAGFSFCEDGECEVTDGDIAIRACEEGGNGPCFVYAEGDRIVWRGQEKAATSVAVNIGTGPYVWTDIAKTTFQEYIDLAEPQYFAMTKDGRAVGYAHCTNLDPACLMPGYDSGAIAVCEAQSEGAPCYIFAKGRKVVWQGARRNVRTARWSKKWREDELESCQSTCGAAGAVSSAKKCFFTCKCYVTKLQQTMSPAELRTRRAEADTLKKQCHASS